MTATAIDTIPGGPLDLARSMDDRPGVVELVEGRAQAAARSLTGPFGPGPEAAWHYLARHTALLALPDGGALSYHESVDPRPAHLHKPPLPDPGSPEYPLCWLLITLCPGLREIRAMLPPLTATEASPLAQVWQLGADILDAGRGDVLPRWPELAPHLDLLEADLAARSTQTDRAWSLLRIAADGFRSRRNVGGAAAAAMVAGDWLAAPGTSPLAWGLSLAGPSSKNSDLVASLQNCERVAPADIGAAAEAYDEAARGYRQGGDSRGMAHVHWRRAYLALVSGQPELAWQIAREATAELTEAGDEGAGVIAAGQVVLAGIATGRMPVALDTATPVVEWGRGPGSLGHAIGLGRIFARSGRRWMNADRGPERALAACSVAEAIWAGLERPVSRAQTLADQAEALRGLGVVRAALVVLESATDLCVAHQGEPADPLDVVRQDVLLLAGDLYNLANANADPEAMRRAEGRLQEAAGQLRSRWSEFTDEQKAVAGTLLGFVDQPERLVVRDLYRAQDARDNGDDAEADRLFAQAELRVEQIPPGQVGLLPAFVRAFQRRTQEAAAIYRPWLTGQLTRLTAVSQDGRSPVLAALGRQAVRNLRGEALLFSLRVGDLATARDQLTALRASADPWWEGLGSAWEHEEAEARLLEAEGDLTAAAQMFSRALDDVEQVRAELRRDDLRQGFAGTRTVQAVYRNAARVALCRREQASAEGDESAALRLGLQALSCLELGRSRALLDLLAAPDPGLPAAMLDAWRGAVAEQALRQDLLAAAHAVDPADPHTVAERRLQLTEAEERLRVAEEALRGADPRFWQLAAPVARRGGRSPGATDDHEVRGLDVALAGLPDEHVVLVYSIDRPDLVACAVTAKGVVAATWSQQERRPERLAAALLRCCREGRPWQAAAQDLADVLITPFDDVLAEARTVHVVASGPTLQVPFAVLPWRGRPLGDHVTLTLLPALTAHPLLAPTGRPGEVVCVGNPAGMVYRRSPDAPPRPLPDLPGAAVEAAAVARVLGGTALVEAQATKARVRSSMPQARVIHLATHGVVDADSPLASAVMLAEGEQLTVAELLSMRLEADLVVLSACETGTGDPAGGDELLGLARALVAAGARAVVATLWPVDDQATAVVMADFHSLRAGGFSSAEALRAATDRLRRRDAGQLRNDYRRLAMSSGARDDATRASTQVRSITRTLPADITPAHPRLWAPYLLIGR